MYQQIPQQYPPTGYTHENSQNHMYWQQSNTPIPNIPQNQFALPPQSQQLPIPPQTIYYNPSNPQCQGQTSNSQLRLTITPQENLDADDDEIIQNKNSWQVVKKRKFTKQNNEPSSPNSPPTKIQNRYSALSNIDRPEQTETEKQQKIPKPPPIFIYGVKNFKSMVDSFAQVVEEETYYTRTMPNETVKITANTIDTYRKLIRHLREEEIVHHTYQLKEERAYRVVIRHIHHSIPTTDITKELEKAGHKVRNITNIRHKLTKEPLSLFYIDLEPKINNKNIFNLEFLCHTKIAVEAPKKSNTIIQCIRCQAYGHSKTYCTKPHYCVKCGGQHDTKTCKKPRNTPAKCALCQQDHPANYKGCAVYRELVESRNMSTRGNQQLQTKTNSTSCMRNDTNQNTTLYNHQRTYANVTAQQANYGPEPTTNIEHQLITFLNEFKNMFSQLMSQNSMILNLLTQVINQRNS